MNLESIAAWGEFLGGVAGVIAAFGVIATLLFLSRQIRQNTDQVRSQVAHGLMSELRLQGDAVKHSTEIADVYIRGMSGLADLSDAERFQFTAINVGFFRVFEEAYLHNKANRLEEQYWESLSGQLRQVLAVPGILENWNSMVDVFDPGFTEYVAELSHTENSES